MKRIIHQFAVHLIATALSLAVLGAGFVFFLRPHLGARAHRAPAPAAEAERATVELEEFTVNLADSDRPHYVKTAVALEVTDDKSAEEITKKCLPRVRDAIIMTLSREYYADLNTAAGKQRLKRQLADAVNKALPAGAGKVTDILFTSLVMQ